MNFLGTKDNLLYAIQAVQRAVSPKNPLPILTGILFQTNNNKLTLRATDLDIGIECSVPVQTINPGEIVLPAKYITDIIRRLPDTQIEWESNDLLNSITIKYKNSQAHIHGFPANEFPVLPALNTGQSFFVPSHFFKKMLRQTIFAVGTDENRPIFTGVLFEFDDNRLKMVATDTHRLAMSDIILEKYDADLENVIVPGKTLGELFKIINTEEQIEINLTDNQIFFMLPDIKIISRLIKGDYPNYKHVIPQQISCKMQVNLSEILEAVERASLLNSTTSQLVKLDCENSNFVIISSNNEAGHIYEEVPAVIEGEAMHIYFNSRYLMEAFKAINAEEIYMHFSGPVSPCILKTEETDYLSLLLPVRP